MLGTGVEEGARVAVARRELRLRLAGGVGSGVTVAVAVGVGIALATGGGVGVAAGVWAGSGLAVGNGVGSESAVFSGVGTGVDVGTVREMGATTRSVADGVIAGGTDAWADVFVGSRVDRGAAIDAGILVGWGRGVGDVSNDAVTSTISCLLATGVGVGSLLGVGAGLPTSSRVCGVWSSNAGLATTGLSVGGAAAAGPDPVRAVHPLPAQPRIAIIAMANRRSGATRKRRAENKGFRDLTVTKRYLNGALAGRPIGPVAIADEVAY